MILRGWGADWTLRSDLNLNRRQSRPFMAGAIFRPVNLRGKAKWADTQVRPYRRAGPTKRRGEPGLFARCHTPQQV